MLNIIICEDNTDLLNLYQYILNSEITKGDTEAQITLASENPTEVLTYIQKHHDPTQHYLYILDLEFSDSITKGVDIATEIRQSDSDAKIIFLTFHHELEKIELKSKTNYFDFIDKSITVPKIKTALIADFKKIIALSHENNPAINIQRGAKSLDIVLSKINYLTFDLNSDKGTLYGPNSITEFNTPMSQISGSSPALLKVNKNTLLNLTNVQYIDKPGKSVYFKDDSKLKFSYLQIRQINKNF